MPASGLGIVLQLDKPRVGYYAAYKIVESEDALMKRVLPWLILVLMLCSILAPVGVGYGMSHSHNPAITTEGCIDWERSTYCPGMVYVGNLTPNEWVSLVLSITNRTGKSTTYTVSCSEPKVDVWMEATSFSIDAGRTKQIPFNFQLTSEVPSGWEFRIQVSNGSSGLAYQGINVPSAVDIRVMIQ